ncbi:LPXTG cell wall anchor domain-containing protein [Streptomyces sp. NRRL B-1677]|uniref:LPXTG cell wall anchor domain-containing protein n=1 Tax=Streptomyces klenkii TaxID=1420899 RepID=A0A3B0ARJ1_9ACTN|nr:MULTISPECIES: lytic polysaccharide monooxygenase [Streptomyces]MBF6050234.1 LPXTG cell wall anchor domain-containing protein [Streptomyces sp. NRRL B-1677]RKN61977.1 LPXTG cell wall anchor domain-containing protein [Streptomyces klenkii]
MPTCRKAVRISALGIAPLALGVALTGLAAGPAAAHGSMTDPVSRVSACFAEGPEHPRSAACKAMVAAGGTQPLYDWNEVNIGTAAGRHRQIIPDGKLCSAGRDKYKGLDAARADWPGTKLAPGGHTFTYRATAAHRGTFELYVTKDGYDPRKPLKWSDLEAKPFAKVTNPALKNGSYVFDGTVPKKSGRHLIYSIWQRSDSPEAFYTCSDVDFGGKQAAAKAVAPAPAASAPSEAQISEEAAKSTVDHGGHGGDGPGEEGHGAGAHAENAHAMGGHEPQTAAKADGAPSAQGGRLAETGGDSRTAMLAVAGAGTLAAGSAALFLTMRRRAARSRG